MLTFNITDRRKNPGGKSLDNRRRFIDKVKKNIDLSKGIKKRDISDSSDEEVSVSRDSIDEPQFQYDKKDIGDWNYILPGNKKYNKDDLIPRPKKGGGEGRGDQGSPDGDGVDDFKFVISFDEYIDLLFNDLELPDMVKNTEKHIIAWMARRAGYTSVGPASNLALEQSMVKSISRRIALKYPKLIEIRELEEELEKETGLEKKLELENKISELRQKVANVPFLDKTDLRYHNVVRQPIPITKAVIFMLMDTSGSMTEHMKDLAKRFYILLYIFLQKIYKDVEIVFIRHTHEASIVDEDTFFNNQDSGGTIVSSAYKVAKEDIQRRFPINEWNIYIAQVSDGDNISSDKETAIKYLTELLPWIQYLTYVEVSRSEYGFYSRETDVWKFMDELLKIEPDKIAMRKLSDKDKVLSVFRSLFIKKMEK
ncbi:MAG: YeaH/YhbH family protein [Candidatus Levybacteria bacterium]|nr:YeaH/YhbH family protein [Candidatus Levybacteria bacterium]